MKCSRCNESACFLIPIYDNNHVVRCFEARCSKHVVVTVDEKRKLLKDFQVKRRWIDISSGLK